MYGSAVLVSCALQSQPERDQAGVTGSHAPTIVATKIVLQTPEDMTGYRLSAPRRYVKAYVLRATLPLQPASNP